MVKYKWKEDGPAMGRTGLSTRVCVMWVFKVRFHRSIISSCTIIFIFMMLNYGVMLISFVWKHLILKVFIWNSLSFFVRHSNFILNFYFLVNLRNWIWINLCDYTMLQLEFERSIYVDFSN